MNSDIRIGTCGWSWDLWDGIFYPAGVPHPERLEFYSRYLNSVENDSTFYHLPALHVVEGWRDSTPADFRFCCKITRTITHEKRLVACEDDVSEFCERMTHLGSKLGCVLVQLPPSFHPETSNIHDLKMFLKQLPDGVRWAVEFRDRHWHLPRIIDLLHTCGVSWVWHDSSEPETGDLAAFELQPATSDIVYVRLLGPRHHSGPGARDENGQIELPAFARDEALDAWVTRLKSQTQAGTIYVFADNHYEGYAPQTCARLARRFGLAGALPTQQDVTLGDDTDQMQLPLQRLP